MSVETATKRSLALGAATNWAAFVAALAVSFFLAPYLVRSLGDARYGVWCVVESILAYFTLFDLGIAACLVRFVAKYHTTGERAELNRFVSACMAVFIAAGCCVFIIGAALVPLVGPALEAKLGEPGDVSAFMLLMLANLAFTLPLSVFPTILDGLQRFGAKSAVRLGFLTLRVVAIIYAMETRPGLFPLAIVFTVSNLLEHAAFALFAFRFLPGLHLSRQFADRASLRQVKGYSVDAFLAMLSGRITVQTGAVVVGGMVGVAAAAHYAIAARLVELAKNMLRSATTTLTPAVSQREAAGDLAAVRRVLLDGTRAVLYVVLPIHLGLFAFGRPFLNRWIGGEQYADWCFPAVAILSATLTIGVAQSVASRILYGLGRLRVFARLALLEAGLNLGLSLALAFPFGIAGVAAAVAIPNVLFCLAVITYTCRTLDVNLGEYLKSWLRPLAAACVPAAIWGLFVRAEPTWFDIGTGIAMGLVPYAAAVAALESLGTPLRFAARRASRPAVPSLRPATARG